MKKLVLRNPVVLKLKNSDLPDTEQLSQFTIKCGYDEKFLLTYTLLKLRLLRGKTLIFVNDVDGCYKLKLFLEFFSINSAVLNSQLPTQSRQHIVDQFNKGIFDYVIASDEAVNSTISRGTRKRKKKDEQEDNEYGISRGVDFKQVMNVLNFDFPENSKAYVHRVGR